MQHFATVGWKELRNPHPDFDLWFYWNRYLDPTSEDVNPAVHYLVEGRHRGYATLPEVTVRPPTESPHRVAGRAGSACSPVSTSTGSSTTPWSPTSAT